MFNFIDDINTEDQMTQEEVYAETEKALDVAQKLTWYGFIFALIGF